MRFNPKARLNTGRMHEAGRGGGGGLLSTGGSRIPIPGGMRAGGGIGGVIIIVLFLVVTQCLGGTDLGANNTLDSSRFADSSRYNSCKTGEDANDSSDCARVAVENSLYDYWSDALPAQSSADFEGEQALVTFSGSVDTGCGQATSDVGPFYCPPDTTIYLDSTFFEAVLEEQLGGPSGAFVEPYVLAHEYGHHIQNLLGTMSRVKTQQGPQSDAVRLELQADCYAGMAARNATSTEDASGQILIEDLTDQDIREALDAAAAVGDDRIQQKTEGQVTEESWTHGSAQSRVKWFQLGFTEGSLKACDTFVTNNL